MAVMDYTAIRTFPWVDHLPTCPCGNLATYLGDGQHCTIALCLPCKNSKDWSGLIYEFRPISDSIHPGMTPPTTRNNPNLVVSPSDPYIDEIKVGNRTAWVLHGPARFTREEALADLHRFKARNKKRRTTD